MSYKSEFSEVYNYLSDCCKDPTLRMSIASVSDFVWQDDDIKTGMIKQYLGSSSIVKVPSCVVRIGQYAFRDCKSLESVYIPDSVISINFHAFGGCERLHSIVFPTNDKFQSIANELFKDCKNLTSIVIPNSVSQIYSYAFSGCVNLESIIIPDHVTLIGSNCFEGCRNLKKLVLPRVVSIGDFVFRGSGLRELSCPAGLNLHTADVPVGCRVTYL